MWVTPEDIEAVSGLAIDLCGVFLDESKGYLIESRLANLVEQEECNSYADLVHKVRYSNDSTLRNLVIDAITTQETLFFRDNSPFEALQHKALPDLIDAKSEAGYSKRIRIWSAPCSTGQEPYSIAMTICEAMPYRPDWDIMIHATDISDEAISRASAGYYLRHEIERGMPPRLLEKYFIPHEKGWKVKDELRGMISFEHRNLLEPLFDVGPYDIIFCRNVAIYFTPETRRHLFHRLREVLTTGGYLFVGSSESLIDLGPEFAPQRHCNATYYQPNKLATTVGV